MKKLKPSILAVRTSILMILICLLFAMSCGIKVKEITIPISEKDHNDVILLVIKDILSDRNNIIVGTPCLSGVKYFVDSTYTDSIFLLKEFSKVNPGISLEKIRIDSSYMQENVNCHLIFRSTKEYYRYIHSRDKYYGAHGINISGIVKSNTGKMAIFLWFSSGFDTHQAQYSVYKRNGKWEIEFDYSIDNAEAWFGREEEVMEALKQLKKERLSNE